MQKREGEKQHELCRLSEAGRGRDGADADAAYRRREAKFARLLVVEVQFWVSVVDKVRALDANPSKTAGAPAVSLSAAANAVVRGVDRAFAQRIPNASPCALWTCLP